MLSAALWLDVPQITAGAESEVAFDAHSSPLGFEYFGDEHTAALRKDAFLLTDDYAGVIYYVRAK